MPTSFSVTFPRPARQNSSCSVFRSSPPPPPPLPGLPSRANYMPHSVHPRPLLSPLWLPLWVLHLHTTTASPTSPSSLVVHFSRFFPHAIPRRFPATAVTPWKSLHKSWVNEFAITIFHVDVTTYSHVDFGILAPVPSPSLRTYDRICGPHLFLVFAPRCRNFLSKFITKANKARRSNVDIFLNKRYADTCERARPMGQIASGFYIFIPNLRNENMTFVTFALKRLHN